VDGFGILHASITNLHNPILCHSVDHLIFLAFRKYGHRTFCITDKKNIQLILIGKRDPGYAYEKILVDFRTIFNIFFPTNHNKSEKKCKKMADYFLPFLRYMLIQGPFCLLKSTDLPFICNAKYTATTPSEY